LVVLISLTEFSPLYTSLLSHREIVVDGVGLPGSPERKSKVDRSNGTEETQDHAMDRETGRAKTPAAQEAFLFAIT
jgi:hypothetical protein